MRSTLALSVVAAAAVTVSAQDCNPSYNVAASTECFTNCNVQAGSAIIGTWTMDHTSPDFLPSLALMCNKSGSNYVTFMTNAGICMAGCAGDDPNLFNAEFQGACAWWNTHKDDTCASEATTTAATTTTQAATTTTAVTVTTTTAAAVTTTTSAAITTTTETAATTSVAVVQNTAVTNASSVATAIATSVVNASAPANASSSSASSFVHSFATSIAADATQTPNSANKAKLGSYALALIAGAAVYTL